ncbi:MAG TPA: 16S rRNA (adenine(1518)-N(6)/adenine(1519)-N(6))-dimethyltransferase RsmA, partial [Candidatus Thermoplasmatota archaeon]|nr:16S rRNA (adenine(1518)-N(6)/adenine(1519)-N(6))-dimethyltransferase RsmA [Candidatus Thermoplasmatota archaeon]
ACVDGPFQQRRKKLRNTLPPAAAAAGVPHEDAALALDAEGLADERPEQVPPEAFARIVARLAASGAPRPAEA